MTKNGIERRKQKRSQILDSFSLFAVVPKKGAYRLPINDLSKAGIGFEVDIEGEDLEGFPLVEGDELELHMYLNQTLFLPLEIQIKRISIKKGVRKIGAEFIEKKHKSYKALVSFLEVIEEISKVGKVEAD